MQYRMKDFQEVYNISENKFNPNFEKIIVRQCFEDLKEMALEDVKGHNMEVTLNIDKDVPESIHSDISKINQVILNLFN